MNQCTWQFLLQAMMRWKNCVDGLCPTANCYYCYWHLAMKMASMTTMRTVFHPYSLFANSYHYQRFGCCSFRHFPVCYYSWSHDHRLSYLCWRASCLPPFWCLGLAYSITLVPSLSFLRRVGFRSFLFLVLVLFFGWENRCSFPQINMK